MNTHVDRQEKGEWKGERERERETFQDYDSLISFEVPAAVVTDEAKDQTPSKVNFFSLKKKHNKKQTLRGLGDEEQDDDRPRLGGGPRPLLDTITTKTHCQKGQKVMIKLL